MTEHWSNGGISPYNMYNGWLNSTLASGSAAVGDYERLNNPTLNAEVAALAGATSVSAQATALVPLEQYIAANLPIIPVTTAPEWFEYNSQNYTGWPSQSNPYDSGQPSGTNNGPGSGTDEVVILHFVRGSPRRAATDQQAGPPLVTPPTGGGPHPTITLAQLATGSHGARYLFMFLVNTMRHTCL